MVMNTDIDLWVAGGHCFFGSDAHGGKMSLILLLLLNGLFAEVAVQAY